MIQCVVFKFQALGYDIVQPKKFIGELVKALDDVETSDMGVLQGVEKEMFARMTRSAARYSPQARQGVYDWDKIPHDRFLLDALAREAEREKKNEEHLASRSFGVCCDLSNFRERIHNFKAEGSYFLLEDLKLLISDRVVPYGQVSSGLTDKGLKSAKAHIQRLEAENSQLVSTLTDAEKSVSELRSAKVQIEQLSLENQKLTSKLESLDNIAARLKSATIQVEVSHPRSKCFAVSIHAWSQQYAFRDSLQQRKNNFITLW